jgi:hypothetical protein
MTRVALVLVALAVAAGDVDPSDFRYVRELRPRGEGTVRFRADGPLFAHTRAGLADLRIVDAGGRQVPWRPLPPASAEPVSVTVLNVGRIGNRATALLDLGERRLVRDRMELDIPQRDFVGRATVFGSDRRGGPFVRRAATPVYDVAGAEAHARSTVVVFPPSDFRFYRVEVTNVRSVNGASVSREPRVTEPRALRATVARNEVGDRTRVVLDLRYPKMPVDEVRLTSRTERYDREVLIEASDPGEPWAVVGFSRIVHFPGTEVASLPVEANARFVRLTVFNADDTPLAGIEATAFARPRILLAEGGRPGPYRLLYGSPTTGAPRYDFARLPLRALPPSRPAVLGRERLNDAFEPPGDARSFLERNDWLVQAALGVVAFAVALVGVLVLRRRT